MADGDGMYVALCVLVPVLWGVVSARLFDWCQARLRQKRQQTSNVPDGVSEATDMYYI